MKQQQVYNLKEFAAKYQLKDIFGAYAAHIHTDVLNGSVLGDMASERTLFYKILLVKSGSVKFEVVLGTENAEDEKHQLTASDLLVVSPKHVYKFTEISEDLRLNVFLLMKRFLMIWFIIFLTINSRRLLISFI